MNLYKLHSDPEQLYRYNDLTDSFHTDRMMEYFKDWITMDFTDMDAKWLIDRIKDYKPTEEFNRELLSIAKDAIDPYVLYLYSTKVMNERWPEAEELIKQDSLIWRAYMDSWYPDDNSIK